MKRHILLTALLSLFSLFSFAQYDPGNVTVGMNGAQTVDPTGQTSFSFNTTSLPNNFFRNGPNQEFGYFTNDKYFTIIPQNDYSLTISNNNQMDTHIWLFTYSNGINMITHGDGDNGISANLTAYQRYYVVVEGLYSNGQINTNFTFSIVGDNRYTAINAGSYSQSFNYSNTINTNFFTHQYGRSTNDVYYRFTLSSNMTVTMTHEGSTVNDTYMYLLDSSGNLITSNDDYSGEGHCTSTYNSYIKQYLTAGTYYVVSEGYSANGSIKTNISGVCGDTQNSAINAGTYSTNFSYSNTVNTNSSYTNQYQGRPSNDVYYQLKLNTTLIVTINHEGSSVSDTYLHLLNSSGERIAYNDDYSGYGHCSNSMHSYLRRKLTPGTYYIVSEGYSQNGGITTHISGVVEPLGNTMSNAVVAGTYSTAFNYNNSADLHLYTNDYSGRSTNDVFHKFVLTAPMNVTITHEGSTLSDTYMTLLNSSGTVIASNNDYTGEGHCINTKHAFIQKQLAAGTYYVVSEGYSSDDYVHVNISGSTSNGYGYPVIPSSYSTDSRGVGALGGSFDISPLGGATYSIPIEVPKGVNGMQPNISIVYNSQAGNGMVGYGTNIAGLSCITRGPKNIAQDGTARGIKNGADDAFYLDGVRLIHISGTPGQEGAIYHPESDPFTTVTLRGTYYQSINYMWFEVINKEGVIIYYGYSSGRHTYTVGGNQKTMEWYADYMEDPFGNTMLLTYENDNNVLYPKSIKYGMSNKSYNPLENYVVFDYSSSRNDYIESKYDGINCRMNRLLTKITTKTGSNVYRSYEFNYNSYSDGSYKRYSRLISVTKKNGNGESLPPVEFTWSYLPSTYYTSRSLNIVNDVTSPTIALDSQKFGSVDLNGDGIDDLIGYGTKKDSQQHNHLFVYKYLSSMKDNGSVVFTLSNEQNLPLSYQDISGNTYSKDFIEFVRNNHVGNTSIVDFDGDGNNEYMFAQTYTWLEYDYWNFHDVLRNHIEFTMVKADNTRLGAGAVYYSNEKPVFATGDINNDGKSDIVIIEKGLEDGSYGWRKVHILSEAVDPSDYVYDPQDVSHFNPISSSLDFELYMPNTPLNFLISDMNGDGLQDLFVIHSTGYYIYYNQGGPLAKTNMMYTTATGCYSAGSNLKNAYMITPGDFNGDGMMDILSNGVNDANWKFFINNGNGGFQEYSACSLSNITKHNFTNNDSERFTCNVMDFDGDGRDDVILTKAQYNNNGSFNKTHTYWMRSNGTSLTQVHYATSNVENDALYYRVLSGDFDGDGRTELFNYGNDLAQGSNSSGSALYRYYDVSNFSNQTGKITKIVGDYGATVNITYSTLADKAVYTRGVNATYPLSTNAAPINVVKNISYSNGAAGTSARSFSYQGLTINLNGRGMLGYTKRIVNDQTTGVIVESGVNGWEPNFYVPLTTYSKTIVGGIEAQNTTTTAYHTIGDSLYFPISNTTTTTDLDGVVTIRTNEYYESHGMLKKETVNYDTDMYTITEYSNYSVKGRRCQPQYITKKSRYPGDPQFSSTTMYSYNSTTGALESQIDNYSKELALTTTYTYTSHGNLWSKSVSAPSINGSYTQYYAYDETKRFVTKEYSSPAASVIDYTYDMWGNILTETDNTNTSSPIIVSYTYDNWSNPVSVTRADGSTKRYLRGWSNDASRRYFILEEGDNIAWTKTWYDNQNRVVKTESVGLYDVSVCKETTYNTKGYVVSITNTVGNKVTSENYTYDNCGRMTREQSSSGADVYYEYAPLSVTTWSNNHATIRDYDAMGNLIEVTDPSNTTVRYEYSSKGGIKKTVIDGNEYLYGYDDVGNKISYTDPDAGITTYTYDALGRVISSTDPRNVHSTISYDNFGRITSKTAGSETITYTYGTTGYGKFRLIQETMGDWSNNYEYDGIGRVIAMESGGHRTEYQYSTKGLLSRKRWVNDGTNSKYIDYTYDSYGNMIGANAISGAIIWNLTGYTGKNITSTMKLLNNNNLYTRSTSFGNNGYLSDLSLSRAGIEINGFSYTYNGLTGNLDQRIFNGVTESYTYDSSDRLTGKSFGNQQVMTVNYDDNGNIIYKNNIGNYYYQNSKPHAVSSVDNSSNLIPSGTQTITYNAWGKVSEVNAIVGNDTYKYELTYGPDLKRVLAVLWKNNQLLHLVTYGDDYEEKYMNGEVTRYYYVNGIDDNSAVYTSHTATGDKAYCIETDQIGSIIGLYDQNGAKCYGADFDPWGRRTIMQGSIEFDRGFTGHEHIDEIGLIDMNGRMYDPLLGRFISVDPFVQMPDNPQNFNRYSYCLNNPLKYDDPDGEFWHIIIGAGVGGVINLVCNWDQCNGFWEYVAAFGAGAASGAITAATGGASVGLALGGVAVGGAITSSVNDLIIQTDKNFEGQIDWGHVGYSGVVGAVSGVASFGASSWAVANLSSPIINGFSINNPILSSTINGTVGGAIGGYAGGFTCALMMTGDLKGACKAGLSGLTTGATIGGSLGFVDAIKTSSKKPDLPPNKGFDGDSYYERLETGDVLQRIGSERGTYLSDPGTTPEQLSLPPTNSGKVTNYEVTRPFAVESGKVAPYYGQPGGGHQYIAPMSIDILMNKGFLKPLPPTTPTKINIPLKR